MKLLPLIYCLALGQVAWLKASSSSEELASQMPTITATVSLLKNSRGSAGAEEMNTDTDASVHMRANATTRADEDKTDATEEEQAASKVPKAKRPTKKTCCKCRSCEAHIPAPFYIPVPFPMMPVSRDEPSRSTRPAPSQTAHPKETKSASLASSISSTLSTDPAPTADARSRTTESSASESSKMKEKPKPHASATKSQAPSSTGEGLNTESSSSTGSSASSSPTPTSASRTVIYSTKSSSSTLVTGGEGGSGASSGSSSGSSSSSSSNSTSGSVSSDLNIDEAMFDTAVTSNNFPKPTNEQYTAFINGIAKSGISSRRELAMFLAQILHESDGLRAISEYACANNGCPGSYDSMNGHQYYGRGYIQLTWKSNYAAASTSLYGDQNVLLSNPEAVATDQSKAWGVSFWFWKDRVHNAAGVQDGQFGSATKAINGAIECSSPGNTAAQKRFAIYTNVFKAFGVSGTPNSAGCA